MRKLITLTALAVLATLSGLAAISAHARSSSTNGQIVFTRFGEPKTAIFTINPDGTHEQRLVTKPRLATPNECPRWSPDGGRLATCGSPHGKATVLINVNGGRYRELPNVNAAKMFTPCYVWSPDGKRLACEGYGKTDQRLNGIYVVRSSDGGGAIRLVSARGAGEELGDWSPDGKHLTYTLATQSGQILGLFVVATNGKEAARRITTVGKLLSSAGDWSRTGNEILFSRHLTANAHSSIWVVRPDGTELRQIDVQGLTCGGANSDPNAVGCFSPRWSPDGTQIVFLAGLEPSKDVYTMNADGSGVAQVTHDGGDIAGLDWGTHPLAP